MDAVYDKYYDLIYNWAIKKTNNKEDAEDLTNSTFLAIFEYFNRNINVDKIENLIWKIAHNIWSTKAKNYIKEKTNVEYNDEYHGNYSEDFLDKIIYRNIINSIDSIGLTEKERKSFKLYYINDLSIKEISNILGTTENNIKYYLYSSRKKIREEFTYE